MSAHIEYLDGLSWEVVNELVLAEEHGINDAEDRMVLVIGDCDNFAVLPGVEPRTLRQMADALEEAQA